MNLVFVVPLETRGAMIQARAVHEWCRRNGHRVVRVVGSRVDATTPSPRTFPGFDAPGEVVRGLGPITRADRYPSLADWILQALGHRRSLADAMARLGLSRSCRSFNPVEPGELQNLGNRRFQEWLSRSGERLTKTFELLASRIRRRDS